MSNLKTLVVVVVLMLTLTGCPNTPEIPGTNDPSKSETVNLLDYFPVIEGMVWRAPDMIVNGATALGHEISISRVDVDYSGVHELGMSTTLYVNGTKDWTNSMPHGLAENVAFIRIGEEFLHLREGNNYPTNLEEGWIAWLPLTVVTEQTLTLPSGDIVVPHLTGDLLTIGQYKFLKGQGFAEMKLIRDSRVLGEGEGESR